MYDEVPIHLSPLWLTQNCTLSSARLQRVVAFIFFVPSVSLRHVRLQIFSTETKGQINHVGKFADGEVRRCRIPGRAFSSSTASAQK